MVIAGLVFLDGRAHQRSGQRACARADRRPADSSGRGAADDRARRGAKSGTLSDRRFT
jgi:hypothetical protein